MFKRLLPLPTEPKESFFVWGPRQVGKSSLLQEAYPQAKKIDLLKTSEFLRYLQKPSLLREEWNETDQFLIIDEVQKVPLLLDEVHWLIENKKAVFGLCGSSARKLKRGHANMLGGRALRLELRGLVSHEIGGDFNFTRALNQGCLPRHYLSDKPELLKRAYVEDYLKLEIADEGLVRNLPQFAEFLNAASLSDGEMINFSTIARDCGVSSPTIQNYFGILEDTLIASFLPSYRKRPKRKIIESPKFYFFDVGLVNHLAKRGGLELGSELYGKAFESWIFHELKAYSFYSEKYFDLSYWKLTNGHEVDFVLGDMEVAIEVKAKEKSKSDDFKGLNSLQVDHPTVKRKILVCFESKYRKTEEGIEIIPAREFLNLLWRGEVV